MTTPAVAPEPQIDMAGFGWDQVPAITATVAAVVGIWAIRLYFLTGARIKVHAELDKTDGLRVTIGNVGRLRTDIIHVGIGTLCRRRVTRRWPFFRRRHELLNLKPQIKLEGFTAGPLEPGDTMGMFASWPPKGDIQGIREALRSGKVAKRHIFIANGIRDRRLRVAVLYYDGIKATRIRPVRNSNTTFPRPAAQPEGAASASPTSGPSTPPPQKPKKSRTCIEWLTMITVITWVLRKWASHEQKGMPGS